MSEARSDRWLTIPNVLCVVRLVGSLALVPLAIASQATGVLTVFLLLALTDWVDGKVARWFDQRSKIGPILDSLADVSMYAMLLFALMWLRTDVILGEWPWLVAASVMFVIACAASLIKFGRFPSYHTRTAKTSWFLTSLTAISLLLDWSVWPLRITALGVILANVESVAITAILSRPRTDVISIVAARRMEHESQEAEQEGSKRAL